jgi:hypothetical protein
MSGKNLKVLGVRLLSLAKVFKAVFKPRNVWIIALSVISVLLDAALLIQLHQLYRGNHFYYLLGANIFIEGISIDNFMEILSERLSEKVIAKVKSELKTEAEVWLSPKQVTQLFSPPISLKTLDNWVKKGFLTKEKRGGRVCYSKLEITKKSISLKRYRK